MQRAFKIVAKRAPFQLQYGKQQDRQKGIEKGTPMSRITGEGEIVNKGETEGPLSLLRHERNTQTSEDGIKEGASLYDSGANFAPNQERKRLFNLSKNGT